VDTSYPPGREEKRERKEKKKAYEKSMDAIYPYAYRLKNSDEQVL
jgi:hypothetical protein